MLRRALSVVTIAASLAIGLAGLADSAANSAAANSAAGDRAASVTSAPGPWGVQQSYPLILSQGNGVSCPDSTHCLVVGVGIAITSDGGAKWDTRAVPAGTLVLRGVTCLTTARCWAVGTARSGGGTVTATSNGGSTWASQSLPAGTGPLWSISCANSSDCWAVGGSSSGAPTMLATTDGGGSWQAQTVPGGIAGLAAVSCPTSEDCWAAGQTTAAEYAVIATTDGGSAWNVEPVPAVAGVLTGVSCPTSTQCWASGYASAPFLPAVMLATADGGATWRAQAMPSDITALSALSCLSVTHCAATGEDSGAGSVATTSDGGKTWVARSVAIVDVEAVSCPTTAACWAVGGTLSLQGGIVATSDDGGSWTSQPLPDPFMDPPVMSCPTTSECLAAGETASGTVEEAITSDGGRAWTTEPVTTEAVPWGITYVAAVSCPAAAYCWAVGADGNDGDAAIAATTDGGHTWRLQAVPSGIGNLDAVSCPTRTDCWAVGEAKPGYQRARLIATSNAGKTWTAQALPAGIENLSSLSCPSTADCLAAGSTASNTASIVATADGGRTWTPQAPPSGLADVASLTCPSAADCLGTARTSAGALWAIATTNGGRTWDREALPGGVVGAGTFSCPAPGDCWASGQTASAPVVLATSTGGRTWGLQALPGGVGALDAVSCPAPSACWGTGSASDGSVEILATAAAAATVPIAASDVHVEESGLPDTRDSCLSSPWSVTLDGQTLSCSSPGATQAAIEFSAVPAGVHSYVIHPPPGVLAVPASGSLLAAGSDLTVAAYMTPGSIGDLHATAPDGIVPGSSLTISGKVSLTSPPAVTINGASVTMEPADLPVSVAVTSGGTTVARLSATTGPGGSFSVPWQVPLNAASGSAYSVSVSCGGLTRSASFTVIDAPGTLIALVPDPSSAELGEPVTLAGTVTSSAGPIGRNRVEISVSGGGTTVTSYATTSATGSYSIQFVPGNAPATYQATVRSAGQTATASVPVTAGPPSADVFDLTGTAAVNGVTGTYTLSFYGSMAAYASISAGGGPALLQQAIYLTDTLPAGLPGGGAAGATYPLDSVTVCAGTAAGCADPVTGTAAQQVIDAAMLWAYAYRYAFDPDYTLAASSSYDTWAADMGSALSTQWIPAAEIGVVRVISGAGELIGLLQDFASLDGGSAADEASALTDLLQSLAQGVAYLKQDTPASAAVLATLQSFGVDTSGGTAYAIGQLLAVLQSLSSPRLAALNQALYADLGGSGALSSSAAKLVQAVENSIAPVAADAAVAGGATFLQAYFGYGLALQTAGGAATTAAADTVGAAIPLAVAGFLSTAYLTPVADLLQEEINLDNAVGTAESGALYAQFAAAVTAAGADSPSSVNFQNGEVLTDTAGAIATSAAEWSAADIQLVTSEFARCWVDQQACASQTSLDTANETAAAAAASQAYDYSQQAAALSQLLS